MSDEIIGISVLQPTWIEGIYRLWFDGRKGDGAIAQGNIFIKDRRHPGLPNKIPGWSEEVNSIWTFIDRPVGQIGEGYLDCQPSVNWVSWGFHNEGRWTTYFVEMKIRCTEESSYSLETPRHHNGHSIHYDLNRVCQSDEARREIILDYRAQGILR
jgi:hypothetical protein